MLANPPEDISIGAIVEVLENKTGLSACIDNPELCDRTDFCPTRSVWEIATKAIPLTPSASIRSR